jgi:membrane associated rhomboid family serine protease
VTAAVSLLLFATGLATGSIEGGFIPARVGAGAAAHAFLLPVWLTPLSATLIHGSIVHLALNLVIFVFCGQQVERALGPVALLLLYVAGAYLAAVGHWAFGPDSIAPMIGASGAISAIIAAYALLYGERRARRLGPLSADLVHALWLGAAWVGIQLLMGIAGIGGMTIAIGAHIGGFIAGLLLARPLLLWRYRRA